MDIILSKLTADDLELVRTWRNSEDVSKYMYTDANISEEMQAEWYKRVIKDDTSEYWIIEYNGKKLGLASITDISSLYDSCSWAFYLGDTSVRGAGIGSKVEYNILSYVFENLKLNKLKCEVFSFNKKVIAMHERFGFRREAHYRAHVLKNGEYHDVVGLALLKQEWKMLKDSMHTKIYGND